MTTYVSFDMAVNDLDGYGQHTGKLRAAVFRQRGEVDLDIHIDCTGREMTCRKLSDKRIRVGRREFPVVAYGSFVGNMAWDGAIVSVETANAIADVLRASGKYEPTSGAADLWDRWDAGEPLFREEG